MERSATKRSKAERSEEEWSVAEQGVSRWCSEKRMVIYRHRGGINRSWRLGRFNEPTQKSINFLHEA